MKLILRIIIFFVILITPLSVNAAVIKYNHGCITIPEIQEKVDFKVIVPYEVPEKWTLDTKTYSKSGKMNGFSLHYMNENDSKMMVSIDQHISNRETINMKGDRTIDLNGNTAYFKEWANKPKGGSLRWVQDGTYIEMASHRISEEMMIELAKLMK